MYSNLICSHRYGIGEWLTRRVRNQSESFPATEMESRTSTWKATEGILSPIPKIKLSNYGICVNFRRPRRKVAPDKIYRSRIGITVGSLCLKNVSIVFFFPHWIFSCYCCCYCWGFFFVVFRLTFAYMGNSFLCTVKCKNPLPEDTSVMTYRGHALLQTLIRAKFSPARTTGQRFIYTGCASGRVVGTYTYIYARVADLTRLSKSSDLFAIG